MAKLPTEPHDTVLADPTLVDVALAADWITVWQSEWAAIAVDQEVLETSHRMIALWAAQAQVVVERVAADAEAARCARPNAPAWTPATADAPDAGLNGGTAGAGATPNPDPDWR